MTTRRDIDRSISAWLIAEAPDRAPDDVLEASRDRIRTTRQRRAWWPAWRSSDMNNLAKALVATAAVVAVAAVGINLLPGSQTGPGASPSASASASPLPSPSPTPDPTLSSVAHELRPFSESDDPRTAAMTFAFTAPRTWDAFGQGGVWPAGKENVPPDGAFVGFYPGGGLFSDPCRTEAPEAEPDADIPVGPTVDDLVTALVDHPSLDVTDPVDVTLAGYSGTYLDLTVPDDISQCARYRPMAAGHIYAQGPGQRWHMWILDVGGTRVLVETNDYPGTATETLAESQAIIESLVITP
jgi:hypothetical protein